MNQEQTTEENNAIRPSDPKIFGADGGIHPNDLMDLRLRLNAPGSLDESLVKSIQRLQERFSLPTTGELDVATYALIANLPKKVCGHSDKHRLLSLQTQETNPWGKEELTFGFGNLPSRSPEIDTQAEAAAAFQQGFSIWSQHIHINFRHTQDNPDIVIWWGRPGCGGIACTSLPKDGDMMYASWEVWARTDSTPDGSVDVVAFACHEVGHALGLGHSGNEEAMMYGEIADGKRRLIKEDVGNAVALKYRRR